ncbi:MAG TPA: flavin reductase family protein [Acidimicrobiales bacterium]|nr:flavin reductase family protein [Acidimicrobiales bacterium]
MIVFNPTEHEPGQCQGVLSQVVVPRPIAMISTADDSGLPNVAPFSYYMAVTGKPMYVAVTMGALRDCDGRPKHSFANAVRSGDFVINVTTDRFKHQIEVAGMEFPDELSELDELGWTAIPSQRVTSPSIAESPAHLECRIHQIVDLGDPAVQGSGVHVVIAEVVCLVLDESVATPDFQVDQLKLAPIGRMGSPYYNRTVPESLYELERTPYARWASAQAEPER